MTNQMHFPFAGRLVVDHVPAAGVLVQPARLELAVLDPQGRGEVGIVARGR